MSDRVAPAAAGWRDLGRVLALWRPRAGWLAMGAAVAAGSALLGVLLLVLAGGGVALALGGAAAGTALLLLRPLVAIRPAARWVERMVSHTATFRALADTRVWFFRRLAERLPAGLGLHRSGDLLGRLVSDVEALDGLYLRAIVPGSVALTIVLVVAATLGGAAPLLAVIVGAPLLAALLLPLLLAPGAARAAGRAAAAQGAVRAAAVDPFLGLEDTLAANAEPRAVAALARAATALGHAQRRLAWRAAWAGAAGAVLVQAALLGALAWALPGGAAAGGTALAVLGLFLAIAAAEVLGLLPRAGVTLASAASSARRLFEAADAPVPAPDPAAPQPVPPGFALRIEDVRFAWAGDRAAVFDGLTLEVPEGLHLALLGPSGAGKSTLAALLLKLALPQAGRITLGGTDLGALPAADLRRRIACLTQDARLFDDTIAENLRIAAPLAPEAALWRALDRAGIGAVVRALPDGLETRCGEGGARFSGGQARRLALARVLLSAAPVVILDEPTAGLDAETERGLLETLETVMAGRTVILITHRLVGVERPGRIMRLVGGRAIPATG
jgi:ATP-binding cassette subfamily C protein CydC